MLTSLLKKKKKDTFYCSNFQYMCCQHEHKEDIFYNQGIIKKQLRIYLIGGGGVGNLWSKKKMVQGIRINQNSQCYFRVSFNHYYILNDLVFCWFLIQISCKFRPDFDSSHYFPCMFWCFISSQYLSRIFFLYGPVQLHYYYYYYYWCFGFVIVLELCSTYLS